MSPAREATTTSLPRQQTLASPAFFSGVGLHTGAEVSCAVHPAPEDHGVVFFAGAARIPATLESVVPSTRCSALSANGTQIATVEHLLAALAGLRIDNARVEVEGPELPALDGSALPFAEGLMAAGVREQERAARIIKVMAPIWVKDGERLVIATPNPANGLTVTTAVDYGRPLAGPQIFTFSLDVAPTPAAAVLAHAAAAMGAEWDFHAEDPLEITLPASDWSSPLPFLRDLAPARTFCLEEWIRTIRSVGLGGGGSIENTVVISDASTSTPLRFPDELARHKALDLLGDLSLLGFRLHATVVAVKAGHALHMAAAELIRKNDLRPAPEVRR